MDINKAKSLKRGTLVSYPVDRGSAAGTGKVVGVGVDVHKTLAGNEYIWVTVRGQLTESVWPSNRLG